MILIKKENTEEIRKWKINSNLQHWWGILQCFLKSGLSICMRSIDLFSVLHEEWLQKQAQLCEASSDSTEGSTSLFIPHSLIFSWIAMEVS